MAYRLAALDMLNIKAAVCLFGSIEMLQFG
jgi:hypothetical protein